MLESSSSPEVRRHAVVSRMRAFERYAAVGSMDKRYVNVIGGAEGCAAMATAALELQRAGFDDAGRLSVVGGPFGRSTHGALVTHMPLAQSLCDLRLR